MAPTTTEALIVNEIGGPFSLTSNIQLTPLAADEALVDIHAVGVCHTDICCASGILPGGAPGIYGHEGGGVVVETGSAVTHVAKGDKVLLSFYHCQECEQCLEGHPAYCYNFGFNFAGTRADGTKSMKTESGQDIHGSFFGQSSFARLTIVNKASIVKVVPSTNLELFCPLGCGIQTGAGAVLNTLNVQEGNSLMVFGVGSVGMAAIMAGKLRKAKTIIAVDLNPGRLGLAKELGATHAIVGSAEDLVDQVKEIVKQSGSQKKGVEFAVDCTGVPPVIGTMVDCLGTRGKAATVGAPGPGKRTTIDIFNHVIMGREYVGCCEGDSNPAEIIPYLIEQQQAGNFPLEKIVTVYDMKDHEKAVKDAKEGTALKAVLKW